MFKTYALYNQTRNKIYIGQTQNLETRLKRHNKELLTKKNSYTSRNNGELKIIHTENFQSRHEAIVREKQLKSAKGREFIWKIITS